VGEAAGRWKGLVEARVAEIEAVQPGRGGLGPAFWDARAKRFSARIPDPRADPFLGRVRRHAGPRTTVLDVGSGPGRFALALAPRVAAVTAVDPSRRMLAILRRRAREAGIGNVRTVLGRFEDVEVPPADVAICSFVLPVIADAGPFVARLDAAARRRVFLYLGAWCNDAAVDPFWRHFHGRPRAPGPTYLDAADLVAEATGTRPRVEIVEVATRGRFATVEEAVEDYRDWLLLPPTAAARRELAALLQPWLVRRGGALRPPMRTVPAAILSWAPAGPA
jgi:SAM-dependent methyltransferase